MRPVVAIYWIPQKSGDVGDLLSPSIKVHRTVDVNTTCCRQQFNSTEKWRCRRPVVAIYWILLKSAAAAIYLIPLESGDVCDLLLPSIEFHRKVEMYATCCSHLLKTTGKWLWRRPVVANNWIPQKSWEVCDLLAPSIEFHWKVEVQATCCRQQLNSIEKLRCMWPAVAIH